MKKTKRAMAIDNPADGKRMSLLDHLEELRWTLIRCICAVAVCSVPCGIFWKRLFHLFAVLPLHLSDPFPRIVYAAPAEAVMLSIRIALTGGLILASPFIFWQLWRFIAPGLYKKEKIIILPAVFASTVCFLGGFVFCYHLLPFVLKFLTGFADDYIEPFFRIDEYLAFLIKISIAFGFVFELPVISFVLTKVGIIDHRSLIRYSRHIIVVMFILAAIITPPDILSQIAVAAPMIILCTLSLLISYLMRKRDRAEK